MEKLLLERVSQRAIVRLTGVARMTVAKLAKKKAQTRPLSCPLPNRPKELELDELWTFVGRKQCKKWLWLAVERHTRRIVAWVLGSRGRATARRLWQALPAPYQTGKWYHTDEWDAYRGVSPKRTHQPSAKGSGQTSIVEAINCSFSRSLAMHHVRIQLVIDEHNRRCTTH